MHVAVAIVAYRNLDDVVGCLAALERSQHREFEVVICENGGPEAYARLEAAAPKRLSGGQPVRIVLAPSNLGYAGGVNTCIAEASEADAWWVLNPDTTPDAGALRAMVERLSRGDCEAVGSVVHSEVGMIQSVGGRWRRIFARAVSIGHGRRLSDLPTLTANLDARQNYLNGASMLIGRRFWETVGPMREDYFLYCEEVEWCLRGRALGMRLGFAPSALVMHYQGTTTGNPARIRDQARTPVYLNERNRLLLTRDLFPGLLLLAAPLALVLICLRFPRRGAWRQFVYALEGWRAGLRGERGPPGWV